MKQNCWYIGRKPVTNEEQLNRMKAIWKEVLLKDKENSRE